MALRGGKYFSIKPNQCLLFVLKKVEQLYGFFWKGHTILMVKFVRSDTIISTG